jgi:hypothetical protein
LVTLFDTGNWNSIKFMWVYAIFPLIGSTIGVIIFDCCYKSATMKSKEEKQDKKKLDDNVDVAHQFTSLIMKSIF